MNERDINIVESAMRVFMRYGVKRCSMNDIAEEAGIARQTLYNAFANKDAILQATIRLFTARALRDMNTQLQESGNLDDQLEIIFDKIAVDPYDQLHVSPNAQDIIDGFNASSQAAIAENDESFRQVIERVLIPYEVTLETRGLNARRLSDLVRYSAWAAKKGARSRDHLLELLETLRHTILAMIR